MRQGRKPFYKYRAPCESAKEGTTWTEELGFTGYQFDRAIAAIGTKITKGVSKAEAKATSLVIYWTDSSRMTWYEVNEELFYLLVGMAYEAPELLDHWEPFDKDED